MPGAGVPGAGVRFVDVAERRARLGRRHRLAPGHQAESVEAAARSLVGLHATDPATVYLSARARVDGLTVADLDRALYTDRSLVKHLAMRRTLWVLPLEALGAVQAGASDRVAAEEERRLAGEVERAGLHVDGAGWLAAASAQALAVLADGRERTSGELREEAPLLEGAISYALDKPYGGTVPVGPRVLTTLSAAGLAVRGTNRGGWTASRPAWVAMTAWLGEELHRPPADKGVAELTAQWLRAFGPGTEADLRWWLGLPAAAVRRALSAVGAVAVDLGDPAGPGFVLPDDVDPVGPVEPWAALLPSLDPTVMGWRGRNWYLGDLAPRLFDRNGNAGPTAWWDGRVVGGWRQADDGAVALQIVTDPGSAGRRALAREADRLTAWLGGVRVLPRFPSPLMRELLSTEQ